MRVWIQNPFDNLPCEGYRKQRVWMMAEAFAAAGHEVVLWTSDFSHGGKAKREFVSPFPTDFELRLIPTPPYRKNIGLARVRSHRAYAREWVRLARAEAKKPDVIVSSLPSLSAADAAVSLGREFGAKVVVDVMDAWPETFERLAPAGLRWGVRLLLFRLRAMARRIYREADLVTGVCDRYRELSGRADYHLAYHGVEIGDDRMGAGGDGRSIRLVYAGNLGRTYDLDTVLKAVEANEDFTLDVAGRWNREVPPRVRVHGYLEESRLHELLCACDVGIIPMAADSWVGIPYKLCDYAKAGLRIVSSLGGESAAFLEKYRCGTTYRSGDPASLAAAIRAAMSLDRKASRRMCETEFDASRIYAEYVDRVVKMIEHTAK